MCLPSARGLSAGRTHQRPSAGLSGPTPRPLLSRGGGPWKEKAIFQPCAHVPVTSAPLHSRGKARTSACAQAAGPLSWGQGQPTPHPRGPNASAKSSRLCRLQEGPCVAAGSGSFPRPAAETPPPPWPGLSPPPSAPHHRAPLSNAPVSCPFALPAESGRGAPCLTFHAGGEMPPPIHPSLLLPNVNKSPRPGWLPAVGGKRTPERAPSQPVCSPACFSGGGGVAWQSPPPVHSSSPAIAGSGPILMCVRVRGKQGTPWLCALFL